MRKKEENTITDLLKKRFGKLILGSIILNLLFLMFGIIIYMNPYITATTAGLILGIYLILFGVLAIIEFFSRASMPIFTFKIFSGVLAIILGVIVMSDPFRLIKMLTYALGLYLIVLSIVKILESFKLKKVGYDGWLITFVTSIILLIFGVLVTINPMASLDLVKVAGIFTILSAILEICNLFMIYTKAKEIADLF